MTQEEKRLYLIKELLNEQPQYREMEIPQDEREQNILLRSLFNLRMPKPASEEFLKIQDKYLQAETAAKGITRAEDLTPVQKGIYLWQGDITTLAADAIVNAANSAMLGCFVPCHRCIDNTFVQDSGWYAAADRYTDFSEKYKGKKLLLLELGVGYNTPGIIKYPFWRTAAENKNAAYVCINYGEAVCPKEIAKKAICLDTDIAKALGDLITE